MNINNLEYKQFIDLLENKEIIISEKINSNKFIFNKQNKNFYYYKKHNSLINLIDRTIMVLYENAINYIDNLSLNIKNDLPENYFFSCYYLPIPNTSYIDYKIVPKNNLILTNILIKNKSNKKILKNLTDIEELNKWSNILDIEKNTILYKGKLTKEQLDKLYLYKTDYINLQDLNLEIDNNYFLKDNLNHKVDSLFIIVNNDFIQIKNIEFINDIININRSINDLNTLIILDFINYIKNNINITDYIFTNKLLSYEELYIELITYLFDIYTNNNNTNFDINIPEFAKKNIYDLNINLVPLYIKDKILLNDKYNNLYKLLLGFFRKKITSDRFLLSENDFNNINNLIEQIKIHVYNNLNKIELKSYKLFKDFI